ncbi:MAG: hypothetical protein OCD76_17160 [Reichenbachiella sp.]
MTKTLIKITVFSLALFALQYALRHATESSNFHPYLGWIIVFFGIQFIAMHILSDYFQKYLDVDMTLILLGGVTVRLIIAMIAMVMAALIGVVDKSLFIINFSVVYLFYLVFEISSVLSNLRTNLK